MLKVKKILFLLREYFATESVETKQMLETYLKYTQKKATKEEMALANAQLRDIIKGLGFGALAILPFAVITLPGLFWLSKKTGVNLLPDWFEKRRI